MEVEIGEVVSTIHAASGGGSPQKTRELVQALLKAVNDERDHERRVAAERRITPGVAHEQGSSAA